MEKKNIFDQKSIFGICSCLNDLEETKIVWHYKWTAPYLQLKVREKQSENQEEG